MSRKNSYTKEEILTYALNASDNLIYIGDLKKSGPSNCHCPKCNDPLIAKLGHGGRQPHFAHYKDSDCHGAYMTVLHKLAELIISEEKAVMVPEYKEIKPQRLLFKDVEGEKRNDRKDLQPDRVGITEDNKRWCIEIRNTHEVDEIKTAKYKESNLTCLEIDVMKQPLDKEALKKFLLESTEDREWINNPIYDEMIADAERKKVAKIVNLYKEKHELEIKPENINLKDVSASISEDGLYAMVQAVSERGISYIFHIGNQNELKKVEPNKTCHELKVDTSQYHSNEESLKSCMEYLYLHVPKKKQEERNEDYTNKPRYEVRPSSDCIFECKYRPYKGDCIYKKDSFQKNGISYVVCNKTKREKDERYVPVSNQNKGYSYTHVISKYDDKEEKEQEQRYVEEKLPFKKYWTIDDYYEQLQSTGYYKKQFGDQGEIVECDILDSKILVLYKIYISNGLVNKDYFYIDKVSIVDGNPQKININFYDYEFRAKIEYSRIKDEMILEQAKEDKHNDLPF